MTGRYVVTVCSADAYPNDGTRLDLPDAEHVHLTRHPDGTWTAVPMRPAAYQLSKLTTWVDGEAS